MPLPFNTLESPAELDDEDYSPFEDHVSSFNPVELIAHDVTHYDEEVELDAIPHGPMRRNKVWRAKSRYRSNNLAVGLSRRRWVCRNRVLHHNRPCRTEILEVYMCSGLDEPVIFAPPPNQLFECVRCGSCFCAYHMFKIYDRVQSSEEEIQEEARRRTEGDFINPQEGETLTPAQEQFNADWQRSLYQNFDDAKREVQAGVKHYLENTKDGSIAEVDYYELYCKCCNAKAPFRRPLQ